MTQAMTNWYKGSLLLARKLQSMVVQIRAARNWRVTGNCLYKKVPGGHALHVMGAVFSGVVYMTGQRFYDPDKTSITIGTEITDNSGGLKAWIKVDVLNNAVSFENGPPSNPFPSGVEYFETAKVSGDIHLTRF